jgi:hypothetical protein
MRLQPIALALLSVPGDRGWSSQPNGDSGSTLCSPVSTVVREFKTPAMSGKPASSIPDTYNKGFSDLHW